MKLTQKVKVEKVFTDFVKSEGGESLDEKFKGTPNVQLNADYLFNQHNIIAELKCLEVDSLNSNSGQERMFRSISKHLQNGDLSKHQIAELLTKNKLPEPAYRDLCNAVRETIDTAIKKANKQIISTKTLLSKPESRGFLFLVNDGNQVLSPKHMVHIIANLMESKYINSSIDGFVYLTVNFPGINEDTKEELVYWVPGYRVENSDLVDFINQLGRKWHVFYNHVNNFDISESHHVTGEEALDYLRKIKNIPNK
jgi:hypothetical protein